MENDVSLETSLSQTDQSCFQGIPYLIFWGKLSCNPPRSLVEDLLTPLRLRINEIWGVATSLNLWGNQSVEAVLNAASWSTPLNFAKHYLHDVEQSDGDTFSLGVTVVSTILQRHVTCSALHLLGYSRVVWWGEHTALALSCSWFFAQNLVVSTVQWSRYLTQLQLMWKVYLTR